MNKSKQLRNMFLAELKMTIREKQAFFWGIFFPIILMVIFMFIFGGQSDDEFSAKIAVVEENESEISQMIYTQLQFIPVLEWESEDPVTRTEAEQLVKDGEIDAAIVLPESNDGPEVTLIVNKENEQGVTTQAVSSIINQLIQQANLQIAGAEPVLSFQFESISAGHEEITQTDFILTGMIALAIAQGGLFGMASHIEYRKNGLLRRLRMTPANMGLYGLAEMIVRLLFCVVQLVILTLIGVLFFETSLHINFISLVILFLIGALSFISIGYLVSSFSKTIEAYMGVANIVSFIMLFLSGVMFPIEIMPEWIQPISNILPLTYFVAGLRESMVYGTGIFAGDYGLGITIMVVWGILSYILGTIAYRRKSIVEERV